MSFGKEVSPQQLAQVQQLARKKLVAECENAGQPVPRVLVVTDEERQALVANENRDGTEDSIVIDVEDIFQVGLGGGGKGGPLNGLFGCHSFFR